MSTSKKTSAKDCPVASTLKIATTQAKNALGTAGGNKSASATAALAVSVTENGTKTTNATHSTVTLSTATKTEAAPEPTCCCAGNCACKPACK